MKVASCSGVEIYIATKDHLGDLQGNVRSQDELEVWLYTRRKIDEALTSAFKSSKKCWAIVYKGKTIALFGVADGSLLSDTGVPWMLGAEEIAEIKKAVVKLSRPFIQSMIMDYDYLVNYVYSENYVSINWLEWCGFKIDPPKPAGIRRKLFRRFWMKKKGVANV